MVWEFTGNSYFIESFNTVRGVSRFSLHVFTVRVSQEGAQSPAGKQYKGPGTVCTWISGAGGCQAYTDAFGPVEGCDLCDLCLSLLYLTNFLKFQIPETGAACPAQQAIAGCVQPQYLKRFFHIIRQRCRTPTWIVMEEALHERSFLSSERPAVCNNGLITEYRVEWYTIPALRPQCSRCCKYNITYILFRSLLS